MASTENLDPQYLYFLPPYLAFHSDAKVSTDLLSAPTDSSQAQLFYLSCVDNPPSEDFKITNHTREDIDTWCMIRRIQPELNFVDRQRCLVRHKALQALRSIGLDYRGGVENFMLAPREEIDGEKRLPTTGILIVDADKAAEYVQLGMRFESAEIHIPKSLDEAARRYSEVSTVVNSSGDTVAAQQVLLDRSNRSTDEDEKWMLGREIFRLDVLLQHEEWLIDLANEKALQRKETMQETDIEVKALPSALQEKNVAFQYALDKKRESWKHRTLEDMEGFEQYMREEQWKYGRDCSEADKLMDLRTRNAATLFISRREDVSSPSILSDDEDFDENSHVDAPGEDLECTALQGYGDWRAAADGDTFGRPLVEFKSDHGWNTPRKMSTDAHHNGAASPDFRGSPKPLHEEVKPDYKWAIPAGEPEQMIRNRECPSNNGGWSTLKDGENACGDGGELQGGTTNEVEDSKQVELEKDGWPCTQDEALSETWWTPREWAQDTTKDVKTAHGYATPMSCRIWGRQDRLW
ncbi:hypothetical protein P153DRAFT_435448 [Dothidotthia symphoricarpi CBS 119687]|uniref:Uncharacterized protein n=1 Tax=Dothidotthia symphoricarpi CBS 119687 TaxID=1392245 RepID=A0A6A5ZZF2_9PLEO|nr:uncharacterized protein P153DRAFT_435448 [Dothidotthia symphoricarpi CBS 119687]KAF2124274.1 hypothetical protein P153DRAFT_435448 [Dothidotthia symphoricarpi CBS 119687]